MRPFVVTGRADSGFVGSVTRAATRALRAVRARVEWLAYGAVALVCTVYLNARADLVTKWGEWYMAMEAGHPYVILQVRAFLSGRLAALPNSLGAGHDYDWGRGGMHQQWGLGLPILATPLHLLGRLFGAPGFPDDVRFLVFYAIVTFLLARVLHRVSRDDEPNAVASGAVTAGYVMVFPTFVGMVSSRFWIYEQTIATGYLWSVLLLAATLTLLYRCTPAMLCAVCAAAGFTTLLRPPLAVYGAMTVALGLLTAHRKGLRPLVLLAGLATFVGVAALYFLGAYLRFGSPFVAGFETCVSGWWVNRLNRWGLPFTLLPLRTTAKEMFATLFLSEPVPAQTMTPPPAVLPYAIGERWREYYAPTFDRVVFAVWVASIVIVLVQIVQRRLWRRDRDLQNEVTTVVGAWAIPPAVVLFVFYCRIGNWVTRYATDMAPAFAASGLCVGMAIVGAVRKRAPQLTTSAQLVIAGLVGLYMAGWRGWAEHMSHPIDRKEVEARLKEIDAHAKEPVPDVPKHFECNRPRGPSPVHTHLEDWHADCGFSSGMVFAMPHEKCVSFTLRPAGARWEAADEAALAGFRVKADFDAMVSCGAPVIEGGSRRITMCDPRPPPFLLSGMRLYGVAALDAKLNTLDRLKLMKIDAVPSCP